MAGKTSQNRAEITCTTCPYCGVGCGVLAGQDGTIKGDPDHPANFGRLCSKGSALGETIDLEGRLLHPMVHGKQADWDSTLDLIAGQFSRAIRDHGPDSVAFYVSGQLLTEDYYVANKLMKGYMGSANIDTNSRLCMASSVAGHKRAFGTDTVPGTYEDLDEADLVVLVGSNLAWCHPVLYQRLVAAKQARPDMRVVNIDPRRTATCDIADLHLPIAPDGDAALFNALLAEITRRGAVDKDYISAHVNGFDAAIEAAQAGDPALSGLNAEQINAFCDMWIGTPKVVTVYSQGVNQSICGTDKVNAIINCHLATGRIGRAGMGPFSVTGQPNAMGGREVGGLANMLGWHLDIENADHRAAVQEAWDSPTICTHAGLKAVDLFEACASGKIKALWIISTNPAVSLPDAGNVAEAIAHVPFTVVTDIMARTDTGDLVDVLLPATGWGEKSGTVTNSERRISRQRPFLEAPGAARPDWKILCDVAARMGWADAFDYQSAADVFREYAALSNLGTRFGRDFDISGLGDLTEAEYDALAPVQWPVRKGETPGGRFFAEGGFYHADGRAKMLAITAPQCVSPEAENTFVLNSGRVRDHWHTMTRTGKSARLSQHLAEPFAEIHPEDAFALGLRDAGLVKLSSRYGTATLRALISSKVARGEIFVPMHWTAQFAPSGRINTLMAPAVDPVSGQPATKGGAVKAEAFGARWYAFLATSAAIECKRPYVAQARTSTGWQAEIAGFKQPEDWEQDLRDITGLDAASATVIEDAASGIVRVALTDAAGEIVALFFAAPDPVAVARAFAVSLIGTQTPAFEALAGRPGADRPDPGAVVCSCFNVGVNTLKSAIAEGADTVDALGAKTCAGTNCGSCKPELAALLTNHLPKVAAE